MELNSEIVNAINASLSNGLSFYAFKAKDKEAQFGAQVDSHFVGNEGFQISPFIIDGQNSPQKIYNQFNAQQINSIFSEKSITSKIRPIDEISTDFENYSRSFKCCQALIQSGKIQKIVLSRIIVEEYQFINWGKLFIDLTENYPNAFCFIFNHPVTGAWCGATPELLGRYESHKFRTMALAGTKPIDDDSEWDIKNINEQNYVVDFISRILKEHSSNYTISDKFNKEAGFVKHLCNTFEADVKTIDTAQKIIQDLHPTPALAGTPQNIVVKEIPIIERHSREYYGGYIGQFSRDAFDFYVNLRSMRFDHKKYKLFVGGGLTDQSILESEWKETQNKSKTLSSILHSQR